DRGPAAMLDRGLVCRIDFFGIMPATAELAQLGVGQVLHQRQESGVCPKEVLANVRTGLDGVLLVLTVVDLVHALHEEPGVVAGQQRVPVVSPDYFDDIPATPAEDRLELLDDFTVAAYWTVQALQVAIDDPDQIVELLARRECQRAQRLGLVHLAIPQKRPDAAAVMVDQAARL